MKYSAIISTAAVLVAIGSADAAHAQKFRLACPSAATSSTCMAADLFAKEVGEKSNGDLEIQVFPAGQLGSGTKAIQQMQAGIIDIVVEDISNYGNFEPDFNVTSWGFAFKSEDHFLKFLHSDLLADMEKRLSDNQGIEMIAADWRKLPRVVVASRPVEKPEDVVGMKFRVPGIPSYIATWQTLGANPTQIPWGDAFQALKTGTVDGMESPLDSVKSQKFHLAAPNVSLTNHVYSSITLAMNTMTWSALSPEQQAMFKDAAADASAYSARLADEASADIIEQIKADGATVIELDPAPFAEKLKSAAYEQESSGLWSKGLYDKVQALN